MITGTLNANSQAFSFSISPGQEAVVTFDIATTITVTGTVNGGVAFALPSGSAAAWTADAHFVIDAPGNYTFTASGVSGGSCVYRYTVYGPIANG